MEETLQNFFGQYSRYAVLISIFIGILVAISGILPSYFLTAANIAFFGFINGILVSFAGEALGAWIAFIIYRKGFRKPLRSALDKHPSLKKLVDARNTEAIRLIILFRIIPFIPSGLVTLAASTGKITTSLFVLASSAGKIPALLLEGLVMYGILRSGNLAGYIIGAIALVFAVMLIRKIIRKKD